MRQRTNKWQVYKFGRSYWIALPPIGEYCPSASRTFSIEYPEGYVYYEWEDAMAKVERELMPVYIMTGKNIKGYFPKSY